MCKAKQRNSFIVEKMIRKKEDFMRDTRTINHLSESPDSQIATTPFNQRKTAIQNSPKNKSEHRWKILRCKHEQIMSILELVEAMRHLEREMFRKINKKWGTHFCVGAVCPAIATEGLGEKKEARPQSRSPTTCINQVLKSSQHLGRHP